MATNDGIQSELLAIYSRLDVIEGKVTVIARAERDKLLLELEKVVKAKPLVGEIYLTLDGRKNQDQIAAELKSSAPTVSRRLTEMNLEHGMVELVKSEGRSKIYRRDREMESVLHLTAKVRKWFEEVEKAKAAKGAR